MRQKPAYVKTDFVSHAKPDFMPPFLPLFACKKEINLLSFQVNLEECG